MTHRIKRTTTKWKSISDHQELATELVRIAFEELRLGIPASEEGQSYKAAEMIGTYMATIACWEREDSFPVVIDGQRAMRTVDLLTDGGEQCESSDSQ